MSAGWDQTGGNDVCNLSHSVYQHINHISDNDTTTLTAILHFSPITFVSLNICTWWTLSSLANYARIYFFRCFFGHIFRCYRRQTKFAKVMFSQVSVCPQGGGGVRGCRGYAWLVGGVCGCGGHAWLWGGVHGCGGHVWLWGACVVVGGMCGYGGVGGHAWLLGGMRGCGVGVRRRQRDTVNERAVRILLECILVFPKPAQVFKRRKTTHLNWPVFGTVNSGL